MVYLFAEAKVTLVADEIVAIESSAAGEVEQSVSLRLALPKCSVASV